MLRYERVTQGVTKIVEDRVFPGLERDDIAEAVAMVLDHMPRTADRLPICEPLTESWWDNRRQPRPSR